VARVVAGSLRGTTVPLSERGLLVGRNAECSLVLTDDFASGRHLRIYPGDDGVWYADDLSSTNGTFLDNKRIGTGARLDPGAQLRIGQTVLELQR
jgi:pSer/pThr/pTyr-binding forkhead associated (FHA) protein